MRLSLLLTFGFVSAGLVACSDPETAPSVQSDPNAQAGPQQGMPGAGPGPVAGPGSVVGPGQNAVAGPAGGPANMAEGAAPGAPRDVPRELGINAPPPNAGEKVVFETGAETVAVSLQAKGFGPDAELHLLRMVDGDFGESAPQVVHIESLEGRESVTFQAPAKLEGAFYAIVMEGEPPDNTVSSIEGVITLDGKDISLGVSKGDQATWSADLPIGPLPENTREKQEPMEPGALPTNAEPSVGN